MIPLLSLIEPDRDLQPGFLAEMDHQTFVAVTSVRQDVATVVSDPAGMVLALAGRRPPQGLSHEVAIDRLAVDPDLIRYRRRRKR